MVNVTDHGAAGDGSTDDTQAIREAANEAAPDGRVYFPSGTYLVGSNARHAFRYPDDGSWDDLTWEGENFQNTTLMLAGSKDRYHSIFNLYIDSSITGATFRQLTMDGQQLKQDGRPGLAIKTGDKGGGINGKVTVEDCHITNFVANGIAAEQGTWEVRNCKFSNIGERDHQLEGIASHAISIFCPDFTIENSCFENIWGVDLDISTTGLSGHDVTVNRCVSVGSQEVWDGFLKVNPGNEVCRVQNTKILGHSSLVIKSNPQDSSIGRVELDNVLIDGAAWTGVDFPAPGTLSVDQVAIKNVNNDDRRGGGFYTNGMSLDNSGKISVHNVGSNNDQPAMLLRDGSGSIQEVIHGGTSGLGDTDGVNIQNEDQGGSPLQPEVPDKADVGPGSSSESTSDNEGSTSGETGIAVVEPELEKLDSDPKSAVMENTAMGQIGSNADLYRIQGRIKEFKADDSLTIRVDGEEISGQEFIRRFVKCEPVTDNGTFDGGESINGSADARGKPPMNGYWYKGYFFEWSPVHDRVDWPGLTEEVEAKLGEPQVLGTDFGNDNWSSLTGATQEANKLSAVARWVKKENPKEGTVYTTDSRYVYYVSWLFPDNLRQQIGREAAYNRAAAGEYNDKYRELAKRIKDAGIADKTIIRLHPEHNGDWQGYAGGNEEKFKAAFRQYVETFRSVDKDFMFGYSPAIHQSKEIALNAYPGDEYVDYLLLSGPHDGTAPLYQEENFEMCDNSKEYPNVSEDCAKEMWSEAWSFYKNHEFGLNDAAEFADQHNLPMAFGEWGLKDKQGLEVSEYMGGDNERFIRNMYQWMVEHNVHFQTEFEALWTPWHLASGDYPDSLDAYQETFKQGTETDRVSRYRESIDFSDRPTG